MNRLPFRERKERREVGKRQEREIFAAEGGGGRDARERVSTSSCSYGMGDT